MDIANLNTFKATIHTVCFLSVNHRCLNITHVAYHRRYKTANHPWAITDDGRLQTFDNDQICACIMLCFFSVQMLCGGPRRCYGQFQEVYQTPARESKC